MFLGIRLNPDTEECIIEGIVRDLIHMFNVRTDPVDREMQCLPKLLRLLEARLCLAIMTAAVQQVAEIDIGVCDTFMQN